MDTLGRDIYRFEGYTLDMVRGCLRNAEHDVPLRPKSFEVLCHLAKHAGQLVSKDELIDSVWPNVVVTEQSLARCISEVRQALSDDDQRIIKTVPRRGYLFTARVLREGTAPGGPSPAVDEFERAGPSLAVLPFVNMASDPQHDYFCDGISEDLTTNLSRFAGLIVIARDSAFKYKGQQVDARQIGRELSVRYLVRGSVRRDADRVRITAQLVEASNAKQIWGEYYDRELAGIFAVQDDVMKHIVVALVARVTKAELDRALSKAPGTLASYDYYLRGNAVMRNWRRDTEGNVIAAARAYYEQSIAADPNYAPAILGLAASYYSAWIEPAFDEAIAPEYRQKPILDRALFLAQRSVELDGSLAEARAMLAWVLHWQHRRAESMVEYKRAFELNPNLADPRFGHVLSQSGRNVEAVEYLERTMRLDPFHSDIFYVFLGSAYYLVGRYEEAGGLLRRGAQTIPSYRPISIWRSATAAQLGRLEEAEGAARHLLHLNPKFTISWFLEYNRYAQEDADRLADGLRKAGLPE